MAGRPEDVGDEQILKALIDAPYPVLSTSEIGEEVGFKSPADSARPRLEDLESRGFVGSRRIGPAKAWWITEEGREHVEKGIDQ